jgi:hypothetical protein
MRLHMATRGLDFALDDNEPNGAQLAVALSRLGANGPPSEQDRADRWRHVPILPNPRPVFLTNAPQGRSRLL